MTEIRPGLEAGPYAFLIALGVAAIFAWPVYKVLLAMKSRQNVSQYVPEHAAKQGTPTMGGIVICLGFLAGCVWLGMRFAPMADQAESNSNLAFPVLFLGFAIIGFVDDFVIPRLAKGKRGLGWTQKLVMQIVVATGSCLLLSSRTEPLLIGIAVFVILFFSNAYNFADGLDWLAGMLLLAMLVGYCVLGKWGYMSPVVAYLFALGGATLPFLVLNRPPAKVFMGDVGALPIGAVLGLAVSLIAIPRLSLGLCDYGLTPFNPWSPMMEIRPSIIVGLVVVSLMMVAELVPVPLQILSVKLRKGKRLFLATPIHHAYQRKGWKESRVVRAFVGVQLICTVVGMMSAQFLAGVDDAARRNADIERLQEIKRSRQ